MWSLRCVLYFHTSAACTCTSDLDVHVFVQHKVLALEISVGNVYRMAVTNTSQDLPEHTTWLWF